MYEEDALDEEKKGEERVYLWSSSRVYADDIDDVLDEEKEKRK